MKQIRYNADDEEPNCAKCDYLAGGFDCVGSCGPEHAWYGYCRSVGIKNEEDEYAYDKI